MLTLTVVGLLLRLCRAAFRTKVRGGSNTNLIPFSSSFDAEWVALSTVVAPTSFLEELHDTLGPALVCGSGLGMMELLYAKLFRKFAHCIARPRKQTM